jgi:hypothetical protein
LDVGFERFDLDAGDEATFAASKPHRLSTTGDYRAEIIIQVLGETDHGDVSVVVAR